MSEEEDALCVLFALERANGSTEVSSHRLFDHLPKVLRDRWSERYLREYVLRNLIAGSFVEEKRSSKETGKVFYALTAKGRRQLRFPQEEAA